MQVRPLLAPRHVAPHPSPLDPLSLTLINRLAPRDPQYTLRPAGVAEEERGGHADVLAGARAMTSDHW